MVEQPLNFRRPLQSIEEGLRFIKLLLGKSADIIERNGSTVRDIRREVFQDERDASNVRYVFTVTFADGYGVLVAAAPEPGDTPWSCYIVEESGVRYRDSTGAQKQQPKNDKTLEGLRGFMRFGAGIRIEEELVTVSKC